jgi:hypothetical protein
LRCDIGFVKEELGKFVIHFRHLLQELCALRLSVLQDYGRDVV